MSLTMLPLTAHRMDASWDTSRPFEGGRAALSDGVGVGAGLLDADTGAGCDVGTGCNEGWLSLLSVPPPATSPPTATGLCLPATLPSTATSCDTAGPVVGALDCCCPDPIMSLLSVPLPILSIPNLPPAPAPGPNPTPPPLFPLCIADTAMPINAAIPPPPPAPAPNGGDGPIPPDIPAIPPGAIMLSAIMLIIFIADVLALVSVGGWNGAAPVVRYCRLNFTIFSCAGSSTSSPSSAATGLMDTNLRCNSRHSIGSITCAANMFGASVFLPRVVL